jgi:hypothetical protein
VIPAGIEAVEVVDACLARLCREVLARDGALLITADHGNIELLIDPETGGPHTAHTTNPVPIYWVSAKPAGKRLLDVLDMHFYPEATGIDTTLPPGQQSVRITGNNTSAGVVAARLQAARSLWDPSYVESSWITQYSTPYEPSGSPAQFKTAAIQLLPREQAIINEYYPGTKISISEYNYGAGQDISGGVAQADVLGAYGQRGVYAAAWWGDNNSHFITSAFNMYLNYDGQGHQFGNTSIGAFASDASKASVYASEDAGNPNRMLIVMINKSTTSSQVAALNLSNLPQFSLADAYQLGDGTANPSYNIAHVNLLSSSPLQWTGANSLNYTMPAESVTTLVLVKAQLGDVNLDGQANNADLQTLLIALANESSYQTAHNLTAANLATLADFTHDGIVDTPDVSGMMQYLTSGVTGGGSAVPAPEPSAFLLLVGGASLLAVVVRKSAARACLAARRAKSGEQPSRAAPRPEPKSCRPMGSL